MILKTGMFMMIVKAYLVLAVHSDIMNAEMNIVRRVLFFLLSFFACVTETQHKDLRNLFTAQDVW
jgi:hypothetical protein